MYCSGACEHLDEKKHFCRLSGEKLAYFCRRGTMAFIVHEHQGGCPKENPKTEEEVDEDAHT